jgi:TetR/AcrR family transcriptional repressor of lmrAB and yxaGH operons
MGQPAKHREAVVAAAVALFRRQGYAATGLNQIVDESGAPKGSLYHYFPQGKLSIAAAAVQAAGERVARTLEGLAARGHGPGDVVRGYAKLLAGWMSASGFRDGCPIATTLLETAPQSEAVRSAGAAALAAWAAVVADSLRAHGVAPARARRVASTVIAALEGALLQARVAVDAKPLLDAGAELGRWCDEVAGTARRPGAVSRKPGRSR